VTLKVVLDTNVLTSGLGWPGPPAAIIELRRVLTYPKLAAVIDQPNSLADLIEAISVVVEPQRAVSAVSDEPDNRLLEAAPKAAPTT
jgi:predicted nucleic acid-binding protein